MVVGGQDDLVGAGDACQQHGEDAREVLGQGVADSVWNVDGGGTGGDGGLDAATQEVGVGSAAILG